MVDPLTLDAPLLVAWTDPLVLGAAAGAGLVAVAVFLASRGSQGASAPPTQQTGDRSADREKPAADVDPIERARKAREQAQKAEEQVHDADGGNLAAGTGRSLAELAAHEEVDDTELISRFVLDASGERLGETMTIADGEVILKRDGEFYAVAPDAIIEKDGTLLADANIDWNEARKAGKAWEDENLDRMEYDDTGMPKEA